MKTFKVFLTKNKPAIYLWLTLIIISLVITIVQKTKKEDLTTRKGMQNIDTYIPKGFVLLPVELSNGSSVEGLLTEKGVVDLYTGDPLQKSAHRVAVAVKIIRSPQNPSHFSVLVPEQEASFLIQRFQSFYAVIQNPLKTGTKIQPLSKVSKRSIIIELDHEGNF